MAKLTAWAVPSRAAVCDEKAAATGALGTYAEETGALFGPYVESSLKCLLEMGAYFHESVRAQAFEAFPRLLMACLAAFPPAVEGPPLTLSPPSSPPLSLSFSPSLSLSLCPCVRACGSCSVAIHSLSGVPDHSPF